MPCHAGIAFSHILVDAEGAFEMLPGTISGALQCPGTDDSDLLHANDMLCPKSCENGWEERLIKQAGGGMVSS